MDDPMFASIVYIKMGTSRTSEQHDSCNILVLRLPNLYHQDDHQLKWAILTCLSSSGVPLQ